MARRPKHQKYTTAMDLWRFLLSAGLEVSLSSAEPRDADLHQEVLTDLAKAIPGSFATVSDLLEFDHGRPPGLITPERLLLSVFQAQRGFARMMQDILDVLVAACATRSEREFSISFSFSSENSELRMTLEQFREKALTVLRVVGQVPDAPTQAQLREISAALRALRGTHDRASVEEERPVFSPPPSAPSTGDAAFDSIAAQVIAAVTEFRRWCERRANGKPRHEAFWEVFAYENGGAEAEKAAARAGAMSDGFDTEVVAELHAVAVLLMTGALSASRAVAALNPLVAALPAREGWVEKAVEELLELLRLPVWQRRSELYSVWIGCKLLRAIQMRSERFEFYAPGGVLSFAFGGSKLATYSFDSKERALWAELRTALIGESAVRKFSIQPDFRVVDASLDEKDGNSTCFVVECKHYLSASASNFSAAAMDYARSCPNARVALVNHGPVPPVASCDAETDLASRIRFFGGLTPEAADPQVTFDAHIDQVLFTREIDPRMPGSAAVCEGDPRVLARILLQWEEPSTDLDLQLQISPSLGQSVSRVYYGMRGDAAGPPYARLIEDVREGPGQEIIEITAWAGTKYRIHVHRFPGGRITARSVKCIVQLANSQRVVEPRCDQQDRWTVGEIVAANGVPRFEADPSSAE